MSVKIRNLIDNLSSDNSLNDSLAFLENIIVDTDKELISKLVDIIRAPDKVDDIDRFASLLADLGSEEFISPLIEMIAQANYDESIYLASYMYSLIEILDLHNQYLEPDENFVHLLGNWLLNTGGGEISWKSSSILEEINHPACYEYYIKGVKNKELFHQTRIACLGGLVRFYGLKEQQLYEELLDDQEPVFHEALVSAIEWLKHKDSQNT